MTQAIYPLTREENNTWRGQSPFRSRDKRETDDARAERAGQSRHVAASSDGEQALFLTAFYKKPHLTAYSRQILNLVSRDSLRTGAGRGAAILEHS